MSEGTRRRPSRRVVYVSRVDNDGVTDALKTGQDAHGTGTAEWLPREKEAAGNSDGRDDRAELETAEDRWLRENVPPHW